MNHREQFAGGQSFILLQHILDHASLRGLGAVVVGIRIHAAPRHAVHPAHLRPGAALVVLLVPEVLRLG